MAALPSIDRQALSGDAAARWPVAALAAALHAVQPGLQVEVLAETASTNTLLLDRARAGDTAPCLVVAERQTAGRGRLGRTWLSDVAAIGAAGPASLTCSFGLPFAPADWSGLSLAVGVALAEALGPRVRLKWPNDLWLTDGDGDAPGRKLGGVLIETTGAAGRPGRYAVIGIGLNLDVPADAGPGGARLAAQPMAGWRELEPAATAAGLLARIAAPALQALLAFEQHGFAPFVPRFAARDALAGRTVDVLALSGAAAAAPRTGTADGIEPDGALRLRTEGGTERIASGELSVRARG